MSLEMPAPNSPPTKARLILALWLCGLTGVLYLDRICMAQAIVPIQRDLHLSNTQISLVGMAFTLAYGLLKFLAGVGVIVSDRELF